MNGISPILLALLMRGRQHPGGGGGVLQPNQSFNAGQTGMPLGSMGEFGVPQPPVMSRGPMMAPPAMSPQTLGMNNPNRASGMNGELLTYLLSQGWNSPLYQQFLKNGGR